MGPHGRPAPRAQEEALDALWGGGGRYNDGTTECRCLIHARLWGMKIRKYELKFIILVSSAISSTYVRLQSELARPLVTKLASLSISRCLIAIALQ